MENKMNTLSVNKSGPVNHIPYVNTANMITVKPRPVITAPNLNRPETTASDPKPPTPKKPDPRDTVIQKFELLVGPNALPLEQQLSRVGYHGSFIQEICKKYQPLINSLNGLAMLKVLTATAASRARLKLKRSIAQDLINTLNLKGKL